MKAIIDYRPDRQIYNIYMGGGGVALYRDASGQLLIQEIKIGEEMPVYLTLPDEEYRSLADAILERESPRLAERALLADTLERERQVSDRLLTLVEQGWAG